MISIFVTILIQCIRVDSALYIHCFDQENSSVTFVLCPPPYILTSCGVKLLTDGHIKAAFSAQNTEGGCYAQSSTSTSVTTITRCCNLTDYGGSFVFTSSSKQSGATTVSCDSGQILLGCMTEVQGNDAPDFMNGIFAGAITDIGIQSNVADIAHSCTSEEGIGGKSSWTYNKCYDTSTITDGYELNCISVWGEQSNVTGTQSSTALCPNDKDNYFMTSCTGYSPQADISGYSVIHDVCTVTETTNALYVIANAICCRMTKSSMTSFPMTVTTTLWPSLHPTESGAMNPSSSYSTLYPTLYPMSDPSSNPIKNPILNPTSNPTQQLSFNSINPTESPSDIVTLNSISSATRNTNMTADISSYNHLSYIIIGGFIIILCCCIYALWRYFRNKSMKAKVVIIELSSDNSAHITNGTLKTDTMVTTDGKRPNVLEINMEAIHQDADGLEGVDRAEGVSAVHNNDNLCMNEDKYNNHEPMSKRPFGIGTNDNEDASTQQKTNLYYKQIEFVNAAANDEEVIEEMEGGTTQ